MIAIKTRHRSRVMAGYAQGDPNIKYDTNKSYVLIQVTTFLPLKSKTFSQNAECNTENYVITANNICHD